jgi:hypothetical protein
MLSELRDHLFFKVAIYAAMSSAAVRLNGKSGIFGCGFNRK